MKNILYILKSSLFLLLSFSGAYAQMPGTPSMALKEMRNVFGGSGTDICFSMTQTSDGGYIMGGFVSSSDGDVTGNHGGNDGWVVKIRNTGAPEWQKNYGGTGDEFLYSIIQTSDGGYILCGSTSSSDGDITVNHGGLDGWVIKISSTGALQWQKTYGGTNDDTLLSAIQTSDGGYILCGYTQSTDGDFAGNHGGVDAWVMKISSTGTLQWQKTYGGTNADYARTINTTSDGGYIISANTNSSNGNVTVNQGSSDAWILKIDNTGSLVWQKTYGGTGSDIFLSAIQTSDGGYIASGYTNSSNGDITGAHGNDDIWVVKISGTGTLQWQKAFGGANNDSTGLSSLLPTSDGGYVFSGITSSNDGDVSGNHGDDDAWVVKINSTGTLQWQKAVGGTGTDRCLRVIINNNGEYCITGFSASNNGDIAGPNHGAYDYIIFKLDSSGNIRGFYDDTAP